MKEKVEIIKTKKGDYMLSIGNGVSGNSWVVTRKELKKFYLILKEMFFKKELEEI